MNETNDARANQTRAKILQTAISLFSEQGFAETSMSDIVKVSELSKGAIYYHFASKEELIEAAFQLCHHHFEDAAMEGVADEPNVPEKLCRRMRNLVCWAVEHREENAVNSMFHGRLGHRDANSYGYRSSGLHFLAVDELIGEGLARGELRPLPRLLLGELYYNMCASIFAYALSNPAMLNDKPLWDTIRQTFWDALAIRPLA